MQIQRHQRLFDTNFYETLKNIFLNKKNSIRSGRVKMIEMNKNTFCITFSRKIFFVKAVVLL